MADSLPLFPLGTALFPGLLLPLQIFEPRYRMLLADLMSEPPPWSFGVVAIREGHEVGSDSVKSLYDVGCAGVFEQVEQMPDGRFTLLLRGERRFRVLRVDESRPYLEAEVEWIDDADAPIDNELASLVRQRFVHYCSGLGAQSAAATAPDDATALSYVVAATMVLPLADRQALLEAPDAAARLRREADLLSRELALLRTGSLPVTQPKLPPYSQN